MKLIRANLEKQRNVYFDGTYFVKVWESKSPTWIKEHVDLLDKHVPGYVVDYGGNWIAYTVVPGKLASEFPHTPDFVNLIYNYCLGQINRMKPWCHGDWSLTNILIDGDTIRMIDWDNLGQYPEEEVYAKLHSDLSSAFGELFQVTTTS